MSAPVRVFQSPLGLNAVDDPKSAVFQPGGERPPFVRSAINVDVTRTGGWRRRDGWARRRTLTAGRSLVSVDGLLLYTDGEALYRYRPGGDDEALLTGLAPTGVSAVDVAGQVFLTNAQVNARVVDGAATFWGLPVCDAPRVSRVNGFLRAGTYLVAATVVRDGVESGCRAAVAIEVPDNGGIEATVPGDLAAGDTVNLYCSEPDGDALYLVRAGVGSTSVLIEPPSSSIRCEMFGVFPPPTGHLVGAWAGRLIVATSGGRFGDALYFSDPLAYHHFRLASAFQMLPARPTLLAPLQDGFYYALASGQTYWAEGTTLEGLRRRLVDVAPALEGPATRLQARKLPWLNLPADTPVVLWGTADGPVVGLPGGVVSAATEGRVTLSGGHVATVAYRETAGLRQLLMSVRGASPAPLVRPDRSVATAVQATER